MKLTVLVDNNTLIDRYFLAEPGVSYFIAIDGLRLLFDVGYSDIFMKNAAKMGIDLFDLDAIILSHAHLDHTWGLQHLIQAYAERRFEQRSVKRPKLIAHPSIFDRRVYPGLGEIGCLVSRQTAEAYFDLQLSREPVWLHPDLAFLGEIERRNTFEGRQPIGRIYTSEGEADDFLLDDSSLVFKSARGLVIVTGCAHAGICNTVVRAVDLCADNRIVDIIGGFHLLDPPEEQISETLQFFTRNRPEMLHACHCTDLASQLALARVATLGEVGVGLQLSFEP